ncbi:hypothetical protein Btru_059236 [Bulinus truncatus]|nr:hypothetical protein Btru_059236 [Bulinus truncatus]
MLAILNYSGIHQTNPGELPRVIFIAVAGIGESFLAIKVEHLKLTYGTIAGLSCASLCYPKKSVELANQVSDHVQSLWKESGAESTLAQYWPSSDKQGRDIMTSICLCVCGCEVQWLLTTEPNLSAHPNKIVESTNKVAGSSKCTYFQINF